MATFGRFRGFSKNNSSAKAGAIDIYRAGVVAMAMALALSMERIAERVVGTGLETQDPLRAFLRSECSNT